MVLNKKLFSLVSGLYFIEANLASAIDEKQHSPIGFEVIFPTMIEYAQNLDLNIAVEPSNLVALIHNREAELKRFFLFFILLWSFGSVFS